MGKLVINSVLYKGKEYFYKNDSFHTGVNILVGDNENGKSTFTYLIVYGLGLNVDYFKHTSDEPINEIVGDSDNSIEIEITINNSKYGLKRNIGHNLITVYDCKEDSHVTYSLIRNGYVYKKEGKTFSDWILEKLEIDISEITQNSSTHKVNYEDIMRYVYHDQVTDNRKIINEFGIRPSDFYKNSNIMKRSIFEILMSGYNEQYYSVYYKLKELNKDLQEEREKKKSIELIKGNLHDQTQLLREEDLTENLLDIRKEINRLESARKKIKEAGHHFGEEVIERLSELQKEVVALTHKSKNIEFKLTEVEEDLVKSIRVGEDTKSEIEHIDKILFTSQYIDIINEDKCPFCLEKIDLEDGHCICGSDKYLDFSRFIYSDKEYIEMMKSKVKTLETINSTIKDFQDEYNSLEKDLLKTKKDISLSIEEIKSITKDLEYNSNAQTIDEVTDKIIKLKEKEPELKLLIEKGKEINTSIRKMNRLEKEISKYKNELQRLEEQKENDLQGNIDSFEDIYSNYLNDFYGNESSPFEVKLDRNYMPLLGEYKHQSFNVPKRLFYYLTMLKMSLDKDYQISHPKLLIIDTMKDEGIEINKLKKLFTYFDEFKDKDCQIIVTCGYDEYTKELEPYLIDRLNDNDKLLKKRNIKN
ncbi:AAA family ATPase [Halobacillus hunanensis]|uniref:AAA family ATPase n=1 Tax=Halobacillus hunanensis TaxID=578214 RepID=UPI0009A5A470|nr:AAA family ATPase [Halobacillus hunanensis]